MASSGLKELLMAAVYVQQEERCCTKGADTPGGEEHTYQHRILNFKNICDKVVL